MNESYIERRLSVSNQIGEDLLFTHLLYSVGIVGSHHGHLLHHRARISVGLGCSHPNRPQQSQRFCLEPKIQNRKSQKHPPADAGEWLERCEASSERFWPRGFYSLWRHSRPHTHTHTKDLKRPEVRLKSTIPGRKETLFCSPKVRNLHTATPETSEVHRWGVCHSVCGQHQVQQGLYVTWECVKGKTALDTPTVVFTFLISPVLFCDAQIQLFTTCKCPFS